MRRVALLLVVVLAFRWGATGQEDKPKAAASALQNDADGLVKLASDLQAAVKRSNEHTLSLEVIHKAEQIELLAKKMQSERK